MEINFWLVSLPAFVTLALKASIYAYARFSRVHNFLTRLYLLALFSFSVQNIAEIGHFYTFIKRGMMPNFEVNIFYASTIVAYAFLFHLVVALVFGRHHKAARSLSGAIYVYALVLEILLFFTPWLISGYTPIRNYTVTRIPGPLYGAFEFYAIGVCLCILGLLAYGVRHQASAYKRSQLKIILIAVTPLNLVLVAVLVALHTGVRLFNASVTMPVALTVFLILTAYATHQYRLFDIEFYIPWSKVRQRKTAFYDRIRAMIAEIADLGSVGQAVSRLADTLRCPVALVGGPEPALAFAGNAKSMIEVPIRELRQIEHIVVTNEIADTLPETHALLKQHGVAAVVPFFPHSRTAASWMLLGDSFSEHVYTPLDFKMVEQLFDKMGELFLDKLLFLRAQLHDAREQLQTFQLRYDMSQQDAVEAHRQIAILQRRIAEMERERATPARSAPGQVLSLVETSADEKSLARQLRELESRMIMRALQRSNGDIVRAAALLELSVETLREGIERCGLAGQVKGARD